MAALALILGLLIGAGALFAWRRSHSGADDGAGRVVAVLPFENLGDSADAYFADGVADEVRTKLTPVPGLVVIARGSSIQYRGTTKRPADIARELGADYLLTGTVRWEKSAGSASRVRVSPELVEVNPGQSERTRWGERFDASMTNVFEVQADIATKVADALGVALADSVRAGLEARPTTNLEAYDALLKGESETAGLSLQDSPSLARAAVLPARGGAGLEFSAGLVSIVPVRTRSSMRNSADRRAGVECRRGHGSSPPPRSIQPRQLHRPGRLRAPRPEGRRPGPDDSGRQASSWHRAT